MASLANLAQCIYRISLDITPYAFGNWKIDVKNGQTLLGERMITIEKDLLDPNAVRKLLLQTHNLCHQTLFHSLCASMPCEALNEQCSLTSFSFQLVQTSFVIGPATLNVDALSWLLEKECRVLEADKRKAELDFTSNPIP